MTDGHLNDRQRLEAIVFGRDGAGDDAELESARSQLAELLAEERAAAVALEERLRAESQRALLITPAVPRRAAPGEEPELVRAAVRRVPSRRRVATIALAAIGVVATVIAGWYLKAFTTTDSMAVFDLPQTATDVAFALEQNGLTEVADSLRFVGSAGGFDAYVYQSSTGEQVSGCLIAVEGDAVVGSSCASAEEFSGGQTARVSSGMAWTDLSWDIRSGVSARTGSFPAVQSALTEFDEPQDDVDREGLAYVTTIRTDLQRTARALGGNSGYALLAYRGEGSDVCLAVYVPSTTTLNAESTCVDESTFAASGVTLLYPNSSPDVLVSWDAEGSTIVARR